MLSFEPGYFGISWKQQWSISKWLWNLPQNLHIYCTHFVYCRYRTETLSIIQHLVQLWHETVNWEIVNLCFTYELKILLGKYHDLLVLLQISLVEELWWVLQGKTAARWKKLVVWIRKSQNLYRIRTGKYTFFSMSIAFSDKWTLDLTVSFYPPIV